MSAMNSAVCKKCGRIGNKIDMNRIMKDGFVSGYEHKDCSKDMHLATTTESHSSYDWTHIDLRRGEKRNRYEW